MRIRLVAVTMSALLIAGVSAPAMATATTVKTSTVTNMIVSAPSIKLKPLLLTKGEIQKLVYVDYLDTIAVDATRTTAGALYSNVDSSGVKRAFLVQIDVLSSAKWTKAVNAFAKRNGLTRTYSNKNVWEGYKEQDGAIMYVYIENVGGNLSAMGGVAIPLTENDITGSMAKLEAQNIAGYQAMKLNKHGYGTLG